MERLESLGRLAGGLAHDFNNLLTGVFGGIEAASYEIPQQHPAMESLEIAKSAIHRARSLTSQLLTFARGGEPVIESVDLDEVIEEILQFDLSGSAIRHEISSDDDLWIARGDPNQLKQVFSNIVLNARDAMNSGSLRVDLRNHVEERAMGTDRCIRITIEDDGPGIPAEIAARIFEPYFTTKVGGHGLGLAICHSIVARHGGRIEVESTPGEGTRFVIFLPANPEVSARPATADEDNAEQRPLRILIMDDEPLILRMARRVFGRLGHEVETAEHGEMAIDRFLAALKAKEPFELVILDLTVRAGLGGEETAKKLKGIAPDVKIIASSGYTNSAIFAQFRDHGFDAILPKPYSSDEVELAIREALQASND